MQIYWRVIDTSALLAEHTASHVALCQVHGPQLTARLQPCSYLPHSLMKQKSEMTWICATAIVSQVLTVKSADLAPGLANLSTSDSCCL